MSLLIHAAMTSAIAEGLPEEVVYLPEGEHTITPMVDGVAKQITVRVPAGKGKAIAETLQAALVKRQASNVRPWFDFEHKAGKAAALPTSFRYEPGVGIMAAIEWTGAGKTAIEGKDFSYLSPSFLIDAGGYPSGLPERGPLAALCNEPAFREIPRIAACDAAPDIELTTPIPMSNLIFAALAVSPTADGAEQLAADKIASMKGDVTDKAARIAELEAELATLKGEKDAALAEAKDATTARLSGLIEAAVAAGKIAPKDEETKSQALELLEASESLGVKFLTALPATLGDLGKTLVHAGQGDAKSADVRVEAACAKARAELGSADFGVIWERAAEIDPSAFN